MTFSNFIFLALGVHHLPRGLRGGCRRGDDVDAPDDRIGDHGDGDGGDYVDAPDDHIGDHGDDIGDDGNDCDYVD